MTVLSTKQIRREDETRGGHPVRHLLRFVPQCLSVSPIFGAHQLILSPCDGFLVGFGTFQLSLTHRCGLSPCPGGTRSRCSTWRRCRPACCSSGLGRATCVRLYRSIRYDDLTLQLTMTDIDKLGVHVGLVLTKVCVM